MSITFDCACGKSLRVADEHAGRRVKCPACSAVNTAPSPEPQFEVVEDTAAPPPPPPRARPTAKPVPAKPKDDDDEDDDRAYRVKKPSRDEDEEDEEEKPRKKKPKWKDKPRERERSSGGSAAGEIGGGLLAMLIGGVLFVLALANDRLPIYGTILFIAGVVGLIKGLAGGSGE